MLRNEFRLLHNEYFSYDIQQKMNKKENRQIQQNDLKDKLLKFVTKLGSSLNG